MTAAAIETREHHDRAVRAYLASGRNADLPLSVRTWIAEGEGSDQDEIVNIVVTAVFEDEDESLSRVCECCGNNLRVRGDLEEGREEFYVGGRVAVDFAESETCLATRVVLNLDEDCVDDWTAARAAIEARGADSEAGLINGFCEWANAAPGREFTRGCGFVRIAGPGVSSVRWSTVDGLPTGPMREMLRRLTVRGAS